LSESERISKVNGGWCNFVGLWRDVEVEVEVEMEIQMKDKSGSRLYRLHERMSMERGSNVLLRDFDDI